MFCTDLFSALVRLPVHSLTSRGHSHGHSHSFCSILKNQKSHTVSHTFALKTMHCLISRAFVSLQWNCLHQVQFRGSLSQTCGSWGRAGPRCCRRRTPGSHTSRWRYRRMRLCRGFGSNGTWSSGCRGPGWSGPPKKQTQWTHYFFMVLDNILFQYFLKDNII